MSKQNLWCLYNAVAQQQHLGMELAEARAMIRLTAEDQRPYWFAWQEGWNDWRPVGDCPELKIQTINASVPETEHLGAGKEVGQKSARTKRLDDSRRMGQSGRQTARGLRKGDEPAREPIVFDPDSTARSILFEDPNFIARKFTRIRKKFSIEIECNGKVFKTSSYDISVGGIRLNDPLPEWVAGYCKVRVINAFNRDYVELMCSIVEDQRPDSRVRIELFPLDKIEEFQRWLIAS